VTVCSRSAASGASAAIDLEHIKEMSQDAREPPFFFSKPADAIVPDGGTAPYTNPPRA
jgi:2-keto-4-pentenoate hydratase/2-oxohepta-3-ene-1,7-dioic acid hydratase in catechol pathway